MTSSLPATSPSDCGSPAPRRPTRHSARPPRGTAQHQQLARHSDQTLKPHRPGSELPPHRHCAWRRVRVPRCAVVQGCWMARGAAPAHAERRACFYGGLSRCGSLARADARPGASSSVLRPGAQAQQMALRARLLAAAPGDRAQGAYGLSLCLVTARRWRSGGAADHRPLSRGHTRRGSGAAPEMRPPP
jgi:hypothetical protein